MTVLSDKFKEIMKEKGATEIKDSTLKHLPQSIENEFKHSLHILSDDKGKLLVIPDNLSIKDVIMENEKLKKIHASQRVIHGRL
jgi:hypothetical protein